MRHITLQMLTWGTVTAAVTSALWLASGEPGWPEARKAPDASGEMLRLPQEPTGAGNTLRRPAAPNERRYAASSQRNAPR